MKHLADAMLSRIVVLEAERAGPMAAASGSQEQVGPVETSLDPAESAAATGLTLDLVEVTEASAAAGSRDARSSVAAPRRGGLEASAVLAAQAGGVPGESAPTLDTTWGSGIWPWGLAGQPSAAIGKGLGVPMVGSTTPVSGTGGSGGQSWTAPYQQWSGFGQTVAPGGIASGLGFREGGEAGGKGAREAEV